MPQCSWHNELCQHHFHENEFKYVRLNRAGVGNWSTPDTAELEFEPPGSKVLLLVLYHGKYWCSNFPSHLAIKEKLYGNSLHYR